jgi:hypothetical protein
VTLVFSGAANPGQSGGRNAGFSSFAPPPTPWANVYWGPSSAAFPRAALDGSLDTLSFSGISGTIATWQGTTSWVNPETGTLHTGVPVRMQITITGLGAAPWSLSTSIAGLDPGPGTGIGAVVNNSALSNFTANVQFLADIPTDGSGFVPLNSVLLTAGQSMSSFVGAFYTKSS